MSGLRPMRMKKYRFPSRYSKNIEEKHLASLFQEYIKLGSNCYDPIFENILVTQFGWKRRKSGIDREITKDTLIRMAKQGMRRPSLKSLMGKKLNWLLNVAKDKEFKETLKNVRPDWIGTPKDNRKKEKLKALYAYVHKYGHLPPSVFIDENNLRIGRLSQMIRHGQYGKELQDKFKSVLLHPSSRREKYKKLLDSNFENIGLTEIQKKILELYKQRKTCTQIANLRKVSCSSVSKVLSTLNEKLET